MIKRSTRALPSLLAVALLLAACEQEPKEAPPITIGSAPQQTAPQAKEEDSSANEDSEEGFDKSATPSRSLPEGSAEQQALMMRARQAFLRDNYTEAEALFGQLATSEPVSGTSVSAAIALGQIYLETGRPDEALALMNEIEEHIDDVPEVLLVVARVYAALKQPMNALRAYDRALALQPDYIFILVDMAELLFELGEQERGAQLLLRYEQRLEQMAQALESPARATKAERLYIVDIFSMIHDERGFEALIKALRDPEEEVRAHAAQALGELQVSEAADALHHAAIEDSSALVRPAARQALQSLPATPPQ